MMQGSGIKMQDISTDSAIPGRGKTASPSSPPSAPSELCRLSATEDMDLMRRQKITSADLLASCIGRIADREPTIRAFAHFDPDRAMDEARRRDLEATRGPLHGIPVGVKDIFATADMPTRYNSPIYREHRPAIDAACVQRLREAGAIVIGKTETAEFAHQSPAPTANPVNERYTPGGSSSGSAAGTADFFFPLALGSQTGGSTIRPGSFCGVFAFKPSFDRLPCSGMKHLAPSLDTVGLYARSVADLSLLFAVLDGNSPEPVRRGPLRIGVCRNYLAEKVDASSRETLARFAAAAGDRAIVTEIELPSAFDELPDASLALMDAELAVSLKTECERHPELVSEKARDAFGRGQNIGRDQIQAILQARDECRRHAHRIFESHDALLTFSACGEPPIGRDPGDAVVNRPWSLLGLPCINIPAGHGPHGLPIGVQLVGAFNRDAMLLETAQRLAAAATT